MIPRGLRLAPALLLLAGMPPACRAQVEEKPVPEDFKVFAQYYPGYSHWKPWKATIGAGGNVTQEVRERRPSGWVTKKLPPLTRQQLIDLMTKIKESDFSRLKKRYDFAVTDNPTLVLAVTKGGKTTEVHVYAPAHLKDQAEVKRFLSVWSEVLKDVPSPNPEQTPEE